MSITHWYNSVIHLNCNYTIDNNALSVSILSLDDSVEESIPLKNKSLPAGPLVDGESDGDS